jgi:hypothetical protein
VRPSRSSSSCDRSEAITELLSAAGAAEHCGGEKGDAEMWFAGMILLGLVTFGALFAFVELCDRV